MSTNDEALKACQNLWHKAVLPSFYAKIPNAVKAKIARQYVCLMIDARRGDIQDVEMLRQKYTDLLNLITEEMKNG